MVSLRTYSGDYNVCACTVLYVERSGDSCHLSKVDISDRFQLAMRADGSQREHAVLSLHLIMKRTVHHSIGAATVRTRLNRLNYSIMKLHLIRRTYHECSTSHHHGTHHKL